MFLVLGPKGFTDCSKENCSNNRLGTDSIGVATDPIDGMRFFIARLARSHRLCPPAHTIHKNSATSEGSKAEGKKQKQRKPRQQKATNQQQTKPTSDKHVASKQ